MATVVPWIVPPNYLAAMQAGAGLGLQLRQQRDAEINAAQRLRLAQDELFARTLREREENAMRRQLAQHELAQRAIQNNQENALRMANMQRAAAEATREAELDRSRIGLALSKEGRESSLAREDQRFADLVRRTPVPEMTEGMTPDEHAAAVEKRNRLLLENAPAHRLPTLLSQQSQIASREKMTRERLAEMLSGSRRPMHKIDWVAKRLPAVKADIQNANKSDDELIRELNRQYDANFGDAGPQAIPLPTTSAPVREERRRTKDGKIVIFNADTKEYIRDAN